MVKIKFTPFVLFLILLVVLVISVLFGYKNKLFEGATTYKAESYKKIADVNGTIVSVEKDSGNILIKSSTSETIVDSNGNEDDAMTEGMTTKFNAPDDAHAFVYEDDNLIIPYINYANDIYILVIDHKEKKAVAAYTYVKEKEHVDDSVKGTVMDFKNVSKKSSAKSSGNIVSLSNEIDIDVDKNKFKKDGTWTSIRTKNSNAQIIQGKDGIFVISMEGTMSTSNYVVFSLYKKNNVINMDPVILKYDSDYSNDKGSSGKGSNVDMSKYVPKTWLNPHGCPKCPSKGDCSTCGSPGSMATPGPSPTPSVTPNATQSGSGSGSGSGTPGSRPGFGSNLVNQSAGVANNAIGGATALGLGTALGATVLGASAVGGATSVGNNAIRGATGLGTSAIGGATGLGNSAIGGATRLGQGITNAAGQTVGTAGNVVNNTVGTAGGVVNNAVNKLTGLAAGLGTGTKDLLQSGNRTNLQQVQAMQGTGVQGQNAQGQAIQGAPSQTMYGQMINYQPGGQQYAGYQFANPMVLPYPGTQIQTSNFRPIQAETDQGKGGNYFN
jgi:hypothetical protein